MSANIYFKQVKPKDAQSLDVSTPSSFIEAMGRAFGDSPWRLEAEHVPILKGMAAAYDISAWDRNPFERLIKEIEQMEIVEVWPEW